MNYSENRRSVQSENKNYRAKKASFLCQHLFIILLALTSDVSESADGVEAEFSGFARVVTGLIDDSNVSYSGYDDSLTFKENSLLGLQGQLKFNDRLSATALGLIRDNDAGSDLEWLYLSYRPINALNISLGQMQTPFYSLSDSLDVGYSYPWVIAPKEVYNDFVFKRFQGVKARYSLVIDRATANIEAYWGGFDDDLSAGNGNTIETEVDDLHGFIGELRIANFTLRTSFHSGFVDLVLTESDQFAEVLSASGFEQSAASLGPDGDTDFYQFSAEYDSLTYFLRAEWIDIDFTSDFLQDTHSYYLTYGYYFKTLTTLITYSQRKINAVSPVDEIPLGLSEELDQLALGYQAIFATTNEDKIESWAFSLRWDFMSDLALKAEYKQVETDSAFSTALLIDSGTTFDQKTNLVLFALEWVF